MAFWGTRVMEIVKKHDSGGLVWKRIKLTSTRKANAKKRLLRVWQNEAVLKACSEAPPLKSSGLSADATARLEGKSSQVNNGEASLIWNDFCGVELDTCNGDMILLSLVETQRQGSNSFEEFIQYSILFDMR
ncbi:uncharacterized protein J3R85_011434 [Psidium guajava]|nr:uncharacterized protein J3R85_011434 [Psidium guajava]